jgi:hypothetical protein
MHVESAYPVAQGYKSTAAAGYRFNLSDPLQLNRMHISATYSPIGDIAASERLHLDAEYQRYDWRGRVRWNGADFYDLFGPTKTGRKGYLVEAGHKSTLIYDEPRRLELDIDGRIAGRLDRLPEYQNVAVIVDRLATLEAKLAYTDVRKSLGWVDDEGGRRWSAVVRGDHVNGRTVPKIYATFDKGMPLPLGHSSVWSRSAAGFSTSERELPFANFFFGGFGNNWVDHLDEKRYREWSSFPGATLNEIAGRNFVKSAIEWNAPPWRFRRAGIPAFYAMWARPALFVTGLATNLDAPAVRRILTDVGGQIDFRFGALSALELTLSVGGAVAMESGHPARREAMISLKILR